MKRSQKSGIGAKRESRGNYIPKVQVSLVKEVYVSKTVYGCSEAVVQCEIIEKELRNSDRGKFICLHFNVKNQIISYEVVSIGSLSSSIVHPREVFKAAILANAASVLFVHNHPSGSIEPSIDDMEITKRLCKSAEILGIGVLDHLIITNNDYFSFKQKRLI